MGLFDDFDIDMDDVKAASFDFEDGTYEFTISEASVRNGTKKKPDDTFFVISYNLDEAGTYQEWFTVAQDGEVTQRAKQSLSFLKARLIDLGLEPASLNDLDPEDLEGIQGVLQLKTTKNAKGEFQNVRNVRVVEGGVSDEPSDYDEDSEPEVAKVATRKKAAAREDSDAEIKQRVAAKRAAREKAEAPASTTRKRAAKPPVEDDEDEENPFG